MTDDAIVALLPESTLRRYEQDELVAHVLRTQNQLRALMRCARDHGVPAAAITEAVFSGEES